MDYVYKPSAFDSARLTCHVNHKDFILSCKYLYLKLNKKFLNSLSMIMCEDLLRTTICKVDIQSSAILQLTNHNRLGQLTNQNRISVLEDSVSAGSG